MNMADPTPAEIDTVFRRESARLISVLTRILGTRNLRELIARQVGRMRR
jgi:hypothetical protein